MRAYYALVGLSTVAAVLAACLMLPRSEERVTMLIRDGRYEAAMMELNALYDAGDRRPQFLIQLYRLHHRLGELEKATIYLEGFIAARPGEVEAWRMLADAYGATQRLEPVLAARRRLVKLAPSHERVRDLLGLYRLHGRFDAERKLMRSLVDTPYLRHSDLERLGSMLVTDSELEAAAHALILADARASPQHERGRMLLFQVLLEEERYQEASERAIRWIEGWRKDWLAMDLLANMSRSAPRQHVAALAERMVELFPDREFAVVGVLNRQGRAGIAQRVLARWAERNPAPSADEIQQYLFASRAAGDMRGPFVTFSRLLHTSAKPETQARFAEAVWSMYGKGALVAFRSMLPYETLAKRPVFAADLALHEGNPLLARTVLRGANLRDMTSAERRRWLALLRRVGSETEVFRWLSEIWHRRRLPADLLRDYADLARRLGRVDEYRELWAELELAGQRKLAAHAPGRERGSLPLDTVAFGSEGCSRIPELRHSCPPGLSNLSGIGVTTNESGGQRSFLNAGRSGGRWDFKTGG